MGRMSTQPRICTRLLGPDSPRFAAPPFFRRFASSSCRRAFLGIVLAFLVLLDARRATASPNVPLDAPVYEQLARLYALGRIPAYLGGLRPLSFSRVRQILRTGGQSIGEPEWPGWWMAPLWRVRMLSTVSNEVSRPYSTVVRRRHLTGGLALTCEREEGRPCAEGASMYSEIESSGGYASRIVATARLRAALDIDGHETSIDLDRAYLRSELGAIAIQVGRDAFTLGPACRTNVGWSSHSPPLDHVRIATTYPWELSPSFRISGQYILGQLRAPQAFHGNLVSIVRGQLDIADSVELGTMQMLQLGGHGAPSFGIVDFLLEHVRRRDLSAGQTDSSNRRFGGDIAMRIGALDGARLYYAIMFEDIRRARWNDAIRYDADHLVGLDLAATGPGRRHGFTVEWHKTGVRSQEHTPRTTGFTNAGRAVGSPLGPDAQSVYVGARMALGTATFYPWVELAKLRSDTYEFIVDGPINRTSLGPAETRYRAGLRSRLRLDAGLWIESEALFERVGTFAFEPGASRNNAGLTATIVWYPRGGLGRLGSE